jgi:hypothetical protein
MEREHYVYALFRPDTCEIFYIGMGKGLRFAVHVKCRKRGRSHKDNVICKLIDDLGYPDIPVVIVRDGMTRAEACDLEIALIYAIGRHPHGPLLNVTAGGDGGLDPCPEVRAKIGVAHKGKVCSAETRAKMSSALKGRTLSGETRAKIGAAQKGRTLGRTHSDESRAKIGAALKGRTLSGETRAKIGAAQKGKTLSAEHRAKMSAAVKGRTHSDESRAKISAANKRRTHSDETKAKMRASKTGKIWINNGAKNSLIHGPEIPNGWMRGRI